MILLASGSPRRAELLRLIGVRFDPAGVDLALFSAGGGRSKEHAPRFAESGAVLHRVTDAISPRRSISTLRMRADTP